MELYFAIIVSDRDKSARVSKLCEVVGAKEILSLFGEGTARSEHLDLYGLEAKPKTVTCAIVDAGQTRQLFRQGRLLLSIDIPGNGIMMTVPLKSVAGQRTLAYLTDNAAKGGKPRMDFTHELILVVLNEGHTDAVMDAARAAGAGGGTVLHAKGTAGAGRAQKFFGVNLAEEKDMVLIVAYSDEKAAIMRAISEQAGPGTEAGAICFSLPISAVSGLRQRETEMD